MKNARGERIASGRARWAALVVVGAVVALAPSLTWSENRGQCALIEAPWPIVLPDGSTHEAGSLKLCLQQMWTPASGLHGSRRSSATFAAAARLAMSRSSWRGDRWGRSRCWPRARGAGRRWKWVLGLEPRVLSLEVGASGDVWGGCLLPTSSSRDR